MKIVNQLVPNHKKKNKKNCKVKFDSHEGDDLLASDENSDDDFPKPQKN